MSGIADYDLTKPEEVERWMRGGQYKPGYKQVAAQLAQAMRITEDLRKWCNAQVCAESSKVGGHMVMHAGPEAYQGFEVAQAEVQWFLDDAVHWDDDKGVVS